MKKKETRRERKARKARQQKTSPNLRIEVPLTSSVIADEGYCVSGTSFKESFKELLNSARLFFKRVV